MISIIFSILSGVTIVLSRSVNALLSKKMGAYQGTFYNYFTGFMTSLILMLVLMIVGVQSINTSLDKTNLMMYLGGIIGVFLGVGIVLIGGAALSVSVVIRPFVVVLAVALLDKYLF